MKFSLFTLASLLITIVVCEAGVTGRAGYSVYNGGGNSKAANSGGTASPKPSRASGISTIGLIMIIMVVIMLGFAGYWLIICYPFFLKQHDVTPYARVSAPSVTTTRTDSGEYINPFLSINADALSRLHSVSNILSTDNTLTKP